MGNDDLIIKIPGDFFFPNNTTTINDQLTAAAVFFCFFFYSQHILLKTNVEILDFLIVSTLKPKFGDTIFSQHLLHLFYLHF